MTPVKSPIVPVGVSVAAGLVLLSFASRVGGGDVGSLAWFVMSFVVFGVSTPYAVYRYNLYKNRRTHHPTDDTILPTGGNNDTKEK